VGAERECNSACKSPRLKPHRGHHHCISSLCHGIMALTASFGDMNYGIQAGIINDGVTIHLPPSELQTARAPQGLSKR
jgi:hypothetical protein